MSKEAMKLALEALESLKVTVSSRTEANVIDGVDLFPKQMAALRKALANEALDKMAENARQVGLDYEPAQKPQRWAVFCQGCRKEWSVSYPHPGKDICVDCDDKPAQQEPFGYFKAEPFGWTDCAESDEGAVALYERPQPAQRTWVGLTDEELSKFDVDPVEAKLMIAKLKEKNT